MKSLHGLIVSAALLLPSHAFAWGEQGHSIVTEIAQHRLSEPAAVVVLKLLKAEYPDGLKGTFSLAAIVSWADDYRSGHDETTNWHFVDIPINVEGAKPEDVRYDASRDCPATTNPKGTCLVEALKAQVAVLADPGADDAAAIAKRLMALKFVVHLMGDLGQPLHCAERDGDGGGNGLHVFYAGPHQAPGEVHTNLHKVWDTFIITDAHWNWGDYVGSLERGWLKGKDEAQLAEGDFEAWANECHQQAVKAYALVPTDLTLSNTQLKAETQIADEQLAKAGVRLAAILNKALASGK